MKFATTSLVLALGFVTSSDAWMVPRPSLLSSSSSSRTMSSTTRLFTSTMDYDHPVVAEEFAKVNEMDYKDVEEELMYIGIMPDPSMDEIAVKLMLVETRLRLEGRFPGEEVNQEMPTKFSSKFEEAYWKAPVFKEKFDEYQKAKDTNACNVLIEYVNEPDVARIRYKDGYIDLMDDIDKWLKAPPPVKGPKISFAGFPSSMGGDALKMTLEGMGPIKEFESSESSDGLSLEGKVTFEDEESAKKVMEEYHGMDMGLGTQVQINSI